MSKKILLVFIVILSVFISLYGIQQKNIYISHEYPRTNIFEEMYFANYADAMDGDLDYFNKLSIINTNDVTHNRMVKGVQNRQLMSTKHNEKIMKDYDLLNRCVYHSYDGLSPMVEVDYTARANQANNGNFKEFIVTFMNVEPQFTTSKKNGKSPVDDFTRSIKISIIKVLNKDTIINMEIVYNVDEHKLLKKYYLDNKNKDTFEKNVDIDEKHLDKLYEQVINDMFLKDWCRIYDSKFSPNKYGNVKVITTWK